MLKIACHRNHVCSYLEQPEVSLLSLTTKAVYRLIRPILYYRPRITSFSSLTLFNRTLIKATYLGKDDHSWSTRESLDQTKFLDLTLDPTRDSAKNNGQPPPAILISRILQSIERRCPNIDISLVFAHCKCDATPISNFGAETFPRVKKLTLYVGNYDPEETHPRGRTRCRPNARFWNPLFDGMTFPNYRSLEVRHFWATTPDERASLDISESCGVTYDDVPDNRVSHGPLSHLRHQYLSPSGASLGSIGSLDGLEKVESIVLEYVPELSAAILMQLLGNPKSTAANLTSLELRFCNLGDEVIAKLLYHAPPNIKRLVLLCRNGRADPHLGSPEGIVVDDSAHLCPLLRRFGKGLIHLEFAASQICRQLFLDTHEMEGLRRDGVTTCLGSGRGSMTDGQHFDSHAFQVTVEKRRQMHKVEKREERINDAIVEAQAQRRAISAPKSLFGDATKTSLDVSRIRRNMEALLDEEDERRKRLIQGSRPKWFRRFIAWEALCCGSDTFEELQRAADMEESGITWVLASV